MVDLKIQLCKSVHVCVCARGGMCVPYPRTMNPGIVEDKKETSDAPFVLAENESYEGCFKLGCSGTVT